MPLRTEDPIADEIFRHLFVSVAEEMGVTLERTAYSPNIKERRDYSSAIFDASGNVIAMGDDMPVHLGSMPMSVLSCCWIVPSRAPSTLSTANAAVVRPSEASPSAVRVCDVRQSRKKSWPANSATAMSLGVVPGTVAVSHVHLTPTMVDHHHHGGLP